MEETAGGRGAEQLLQQYPDPARPAGDDWQPPFPTPVAGADSTLMRSRKASGKSLIQNSPGAPSRMIAIDTNLLLYAYSAAANLEDFQDFGFTRVWNPLDSF